MASSCVAPDVQWEMEAGDLDPWNIVEWRSHFSILKELCLYFSVCFYSLLIYFKYFQWFSGAETNYVLCDYHLSPRAGFFGTLTYRKMQLPFINIGGRGVSFYLSSYFRFSSFLSRTFHIFKLQGMILWLLSSIDVSRFNWGVLAPWYVVKCKPHFSVFDDIT